LPRMKTINLLKAIRAHCIDCSGGSWKEIEKCPIRKCPLYPYRFGEKITKEEKPKFTRKKKERRAIT